ncbi:MAG: hypothetical protein DHS20C18_10950 [Saprospiraceae bacterium]|nr:MAG: hypothetical protein DHS20C18_10950 [Saprospiraceae bacterium]
MLGRHSSEGTRQRWEAIRFNLDIPLRNNSTIPDGVIIKENVCFRKEDKGMKESMSGSTFGRLIRG